MRRSEVLWHPMIGPIHDDRARDVEQIVKRRACYLVREGRVDDGGCADCIVVMQSGFECMGASDLLHQLPLSFPWFSASESRTSRMWIAQDGVEETSEADCASGAVLGVLVVTGYWSGIWLQNQIPTSVW